MKSAYVEINARMRLLTNVVSSERRLDTSGCRCCQRGDVTAGKVHDVNEITHSGPISTIPISAKDVQDWSGSCEDCGDNWNQVARLLPWVFTQESRLMTANLCHSSQLQTYGIDGFVLTGLKYRSAVIDQVGSDQVKSARIDSHMNFERPYGDVSPKTPGRARTLEPSSPTKVSG